MATMVSMRGWFREVVAQLFHSSTEGTNMPLAKEATFYILKGNNNVITLLDPIKRRTRLWEVREETKKTVRTESTDRGMRKLGTG